MPLCLPVVGLLCVVSILPARTLTIQIDPESGPSSAPQPKWWLVEQQRGKGKSWESTSFLNAGGPLDQYNFVQLQELWENKMGNGSPMFAVRQIDYNGALPRFSYMFPVHEEDQKQVFDQSVLEPYVSYNLARDIQACCQSGNGYAVDVGGNFGWYSLLLASLGCQVDTFEPVPWFYSLLNFTKTELNTRPVNERITLHAGKVLGSEYGDTRTMVVPTQGLTGAAGVDGANVHGHLAACGTSAACFDVTMTTVDKELLSKQNEASKAACAMKVDVEGFEPDVFAGAGLFMNSSKPKVVIMELSPGMQGRLGRSNAENVRALESLVALGYTPHLLHWKTIKSYDWKVIQTRIDKFVYQKDMAGLVKQCGYNCMVYFKSGR